MNTEGSTSDWTGVVVAAPNGSTRRAVLSAGVGAAGAVLAACSGRSDVSTGDAPRIKGPTKLEMGHYFAEGPRLDLIRTSSKKFEEENPGATVEAPPITDVYWDALKTRFAAGTAPDICIGSGAVFLDLLEKNAWQLVDPYLKRDRSIDLKKYYAQPDIFDKDGKYYGLPFMVTPTVFYYNKTLFARAGVPEPTEKWTWDDLLDASKRLTKSGENQWGVQITPAFEFNVLTFIWSAGGDYINKERTKTTLDEPAAIEGMQYVADLYLKHQVSPPAGTRFTPDEFSSGQIAMKPLGIGSVGSMYEPRIGTNFQWDVAWRPRHPKTGKRHGSFNGNPFMQINPQITTTKNPDAAWLLLKHMASPFVQGLIGQTRIQMPTLISAANDKATFLRQPPQNMHVAHEMMESSLNLRFHGKWTDWYTAIQAAMMPAFNGQKSVREAALDATAKGDAILRGN